MNRYSLKFNIWFFLIICTFLALAIVMCVQILAIRSNYSYFSQKELTNRAEDFADICRQANYEELLYAADFPQDINLALFDVNGGVIWTTGNFYENDMLEELQKDILSENKPVYGIGEKDERRIAYYGERFQQPVSGGTRDVYIYASLDVDLNSITVKALIAQWILLSSVVMIIAVVIGYFVARRLVQPIDNINKMAKQLASGKKEVYFASSGYTEIDEISNSLSLTAKQLEETDVLKNELIANVSHDLKTPITLIKSYAEMVRDLSGDNKAKRTEHTNVIIAEADRLTMLVNDLVELSKLNAHANELNPTQFDIGELVIETARSFASLEGFTFDFDVDEGLYVFADKEKIKQVVFNLVNNAVNYSGERKYVGVKAKRIDNDVRVDIIDHGEGILSSEINFIWDRYYRSDRKHKREVKGSGLGLSIVKGILTSHDAHFGVESTYGEGSDFYFVLNYSSK